MTTKKRSMIDKKEDDFAVYGKKKQKNYEINFRYTTIKKIKKTKIKMREG